MEDQTIENKQLFLREEIINKGFDAQEFCIFLQDLKGEEKVDLEYWSMEELKNAVESFKDSKLMKNIEKQSEESKKRRHSSVDNSKSRKNRKFINKNEKSFGKTASLQIEAKIKTTKNSEEKSLWESFEELNPSENENNNENEIIEDEEEEETKIKCIKLKENEITNRDDLYIEINIKETTKKTVLSNLSEIEIKTIPIGFKSIRKINDFEYLSKKLKLINSEIFNPVLYIHKSENTEVISNDTIIYLNLYLNSLIHNSYFRTIPIFFDFLTKNEEDWEKIKIEKYDKIKEENKRNNIPNLDGFFNLEMESGDDEKCLKINEELNVKNEIFNKLNKNIDELLKLFEKVNFTLKNISGCFGELKNNYIDSPNITNLLAHLEIIVKVWGNGYDTQKKFFKEDFRYFFKYMNKENNSFFKYYNNFKVIYDAFKSKFDKMKSILYPSDKDKKILKNLQREFSFKSINVLGEYKKLNESQAKRIENKLNKLSDNRNIIFKDNDNILSLLNFFSLKKLENEEKDAKNKNIKNNNLKDKNEKKDKE